MITQFDSVDLGQIPADAEAVAGYVGGRWPTFGQLAERFPHAHRLSIAVSAAQAADCLDVENGDATPLQAARWVRQQATRGIVRPVVYGSLSTTVQTLRNLNAAGIGRGQVRVWTAHPTNVAHICTNHCYQGLPANFQADGTQWNWRALGRNLDESLLLQSFYPAPPIKAKPPVKAAIKRAVTVHPKTAGATAAGGLVVALVGVLHGSGLLHGLSPAEWSALAAAAASAAAYLTPAK